jgi:hypothetical protein
MIRTAEEIINSPLEKYLLDMTTLFSQTVFPLDTLPAIQYILDLTLLKMTGNLEQKLDTIKLHIAVYDPDVRFNTLRKGSRISSNIETISLIYSTLEQQVLLLNPNYKKIPMLGNDKVLKKVQKIIKEILSRTEMNRYLKGVDIYNFSAYLYPQKHLKKINLLLSKKASYPNFEKDKEKLTEIREHIQNLKYDLDLGKIYTNTIRYRNNIAHNIDCSYKDYPSIKDMAEEDFKYESFCFRFLILIYIDNVFMSLFYEYTNLKTKMIY